MCSKNWFIWKIDIYFVSNYIYHFLFRMWSSIAHLSYKIIINGYIQAWLYFYKYFLHIDQRFLFSPFFFVSYPTVWNNVLFNLSFTWKSVNTKRCWKRSGAGWPRWKSRSTRTSRFSSSNRIKSMFTTTLNFDAKIYIL